MEASFETRHSSATIEAVERNIVLSGEHMNKLRINGVVRLAESLRRELSQPMAPARRDQLREVAVEAIGQITHIIASNGTSVQALSTPTRSAFEFIRSINFDAVELAPEAAHRPVGCIRYRGLKRDWERRLNVLGRPLPPNGTDALYDWIGTTSRYIERQIETDGILPQDLTASTREIRGWLAFFSQRDCFDAYLQAVGRAQSSIEFALQRAERPRLLVTVHFRPFAGLYRLRVQPGGSLAVLPTPMICFSSEDFAALAEQIYFHGGKQRVLEAVAGEEYQAVQAELEALGGIVEMTCGVHRDLKDSFDRVNRAYFDGAMTRPRLTWSRVFTGCKFGHYDPIRGSIMISSVLDQAVVPEFVVDFIMYHELLHRKFGADWRGGRMAVHTPEFRRAEEQFERFVEAENHLQRLASGTPIAFP